jgi:threonine/homoserine/homoserine lactone efflux protein
MTLFLLAAMILFIVPGPVVLYVVTRSVTQGTRAGLVSVAGVHVGSLVHIAAAVVGLSALIATSATAFGVIKWAGAAYLVYLGIKAFSAADTEFAPGSAEPRSLHRVFWQGAFVNVLNPKTAVFFVAFVPQFVVPGRGSTTTQLLVLGALFVVAGMLSDGIYAVVGGTIGERLARRPALRRAQRYLAGVIYLGLGVAAAFTAGPVDR